MSEEIIGCEFKANDAILVGDGVPSYEQKVNNVPFHAYKLNFDVFYCFSVPESIEHKNGGLVKIGKASFSIENNIAKYSGEVIGTVLELNAESLAEVAKVAAGKRIKQYTNTVGIGVDLHWVEISRIKNMTDKSIHRVLEKNGYDHHDFNNGSTAQEWYPVTPEEARNAFITASKGSNKESDYVKKILRPEQNRFLLNTKTAFLGCLSGTSTAAQRLWDAKMRFGKTMTAMELVKTIWEENPELINRVHIITHRPTGVEENWRESFQDVFRGTNWQYATKNDLVLPSDVDVNAMPMQNQNSKESRYGFDKINPAAPLIYFSSMQDMRGKKNKEDSDFKQSNEKIYKEQWDLVIVDEAQEGNTTDLAVEVHEKLSRKFTLLLSGTPYKYLETGEFKEEEIDSWDYVMEQEAKEAWDVKVETGETTETNPYQNPKMWIQVIDIRDVTMNAYTNSTDSGYDNYFDFSSMFKTLELDGIEQFVEKEAVNAFLDNISRDLESEGTNTSFDNSHMPYSLARRESTQHALWVLTSVDSCKAMAKALGEHKFFKDYTIVNVAGNDKEAKNASESVSKAIKASNKTITLTVGRMTVGATVKEWSAVLMLCNTNSAASYMQTIFRVQSPHDQLIEVNGEKVLKTKTDAFVWDFAPDRVLRVFTDVSEVSIKAGEKSTAKSEESLKRLLTFLPIVSYIQNGDMKVLDAGDVIRELKRVYSQRVVSNGFESPFLFVRDYSNLPDDFREALENIRSASFNSIPTLRTVQGDPKVTIAQTGLDNKSEKELLNSEKELLNSEEEFKEKAKEQDLTEEEKDERKRINEEINQINEEINQRKSITYLLNTISVRIPYLVLALNADKKFSNEFLRTNFKFETLLNEIDDESWFEVFGFIEKGDVLKVIPAFDEVVLHSAIINLLDELEKAISLMDSDHEEYARRIINIIARLRNPNKETVMTPYPAVETVYQAAGFMDEKDFALAIAKADNQTPTFFDINVKSGLFPFHAALNIKRVSSENLKLSEIADKYIYANSRTPVGKMITATLLGKDKDWNNITVIDVYEELLSEDLAKAKLTDEDKQQFVGHFLLAPLRNKQFRNYDISDITNESHRVRVIEIIKQGRKNMADRIDTNEADDSTQKLNQDAGLRFDFVISNPPYQDGSIAVNQAPPIYHHFYNVSVLVGDKSTLIFKDNWAKAHDKSNKKLADWRDKVLMQKQFRSITFLGQIFPTASVTTCIINAARTPTQNDFILVNGNQYPYPEEGGPIMLPEEYRLYMAVKGAPKVGERVLRYSDFSNSRESLRSSKKLTKGDLDILSFVDKKRVTTKGYVKDIIRPECSNFVENNYKVSFAEIRPWQQNQKNWYYPQKSHQIPGEGFSCLIFGSEEESQNYIKYIKTNFWLACCLLSRINSEDRIGNLNYIPDLQNYTNKNPIFANDVSIEELNIMLLSLFDIQAKDVSAVIDAKISKD
jgi:hypothetical protein